MIDDFGVAPVLYNEKRFRKSATNTHFQRERNLISFSASTASYPRQGGEQDRASVIWQLAGIGRGDGGRFVAGADIDLFVAGVRDAETWRIHVVGQEQIEIDGQPTSAWHVVRAPRPGSYDQRIDIWLAPDRQWYPVKLRYTEASGDYLDLLLSNLKPPQPPAAVADTPAADNPAAKPRMDQLMLRFLLSTSIATLLLAALPALGATDAGHPAPKRKFNLPPSVDLVYAIDARQGGLRIQGSALVQWRNGGQHYSVAAETRAMLVGKILDAKSEGAIDAYGLAPASFTEKRFRKDATSTTFDRAARTITFAQSDASYPLIGGEQDRTSITWQLVAIARAQPKKFTPGSEWPFFVAGQRDAERWSFKVIQPGKNPHPGRRAAGAAHRARAAARRTRARGWTCGWHRGWNGIRSSCASLTPTANTSNRRCRNTASHNLDTFRYLREYADKHLISADFFYGFKNTTTSIKSQSR